ncbi:transglutaminase domain-containing protein [Algibacter sp. TI.3.09]|uniref:transglutaminase domain-containing protein n=1 Tax=Algibacter sp. TI.3.09 TaxID=3121298 RepID=UPI00311D968C
MKHFLFILIFLVGFTAASQQSDFNTIDFKKADSISVLYNNTALKNLPVLAYNLTFHLDSDVEKFRVIYKWVCLNIEGDYGFYLKTTRKRKKFKNDSLAFTNWNKSLQKKVFKQLVENQKTICSGYAYLIKELASLSGIACEIVNGYSRSPSSQIGALSVANHSWNAVKLNNKWYLVDATLASGYFNVNENKFIKSYNDGYFLAEPEQFSKSHFPLDSKWLLSDEAIDSDQFVNGPMVYGSSFKYKVSPISPKSLKNEILKNDYVVFKLMVFEEQDINDIELVIIKGGSFKVIKLVNYKYEDGLFEFKYQFDKRGSFDVHLKKGNDILASYSVKVDKGKTI